MGFDSKGLDDYIDVAQRIAEFRTKHPDGSLQPLNPEHPFEIRELAGAGKDGKEVRGTFIIYIAAAYRSPDDRRPGVGCAYEVFPGRTPYTAGSELQNAETAAWGRAIVAALAADTRAGIASQQEVRNRQAERGQQPAEAFENATPAQPRQNSHASRPAPARPDAPAAADGEVDMDAQVFADEAARATLPREIEDIHRRARKAQVLGKPARNPDSGGVGKLAIFLEWRRKQVLAAIRLAPDDPWALKIEELAAAEDADAAIAELAGHLGEGVIDEDRYRRIEAAILAKFPESCTKTEQAA